jgi:CPA2 family monovalent cation:H+ antiporter-2
MDSTTHDLSRVLIELGLVIIGLAILARIASRWTFSAIPLYLLAGLAFGNGGLAPLNVSAGFIHIGAEIGVLLLLFMLGLEYSGGELAESLRGGFPGAIVDLVLNFTPGLIAGLFLRWKPLAAVLLGGVTYVSSSGVIAKVLADLRRLENPETPAVLSILVLEDLAMAVYLPLVAVLLASLASRCQAQWPNKRIGFSPRFVTCLPQRSFSSLGFRSIRQPCRQCCCPPSYWVAPPW